VVRDFKDKSQASGHHSRNHTFFEHRTRLLVSWTFNLAFVAILLIGPYMVYRGDWIPAVFITMIKIYQQMDRRFQKIIEILLKMHRTTLSLKDVLGWVNADTGLETRIKSHRTVLSIANSLQAAGCQAYARGDGVSGPEAGTRVFHWKRGNGIVTEVTASEKPYTVEFEGGETHRYNLKSVMKLRPRLRSATASFADLVIASSHPTSRHLLTIEIQNLAYLWEETLEIDDNEPNTLPSMKGKLRTVLAGITCSIPIGYMFLVQGQLGCGKDVDLVMRLLGGSLQPSSGIVYIPPQLRVLAVPAEPVLLSGTLWENLIYANPDAPEEYVR
jgi:ABC-type multidrug transport system fused ATPase/permease subunit